MSHFSYALRTSVLHNKTTIEISWQEKPFAEVYATPEGMRIHYYGKADIDDQLADFMEVLWIAQSKLMNRQPQS